jgi:hypothetical protein
MIRVQRKDSSMDTQDVLSRRKSGDLGATDALDLTVLGVCVGSGLTEIDCALLRFSQKVPNAPLRVCLLQASVHA